MEGESQSAKDNDFITEVLIAEGHVKHTLELDEREKQRKLKKKKK